MDEAGPFAHLRMVNGELGTAGTSGREVVQRPAVVDIYMIVKIRFYIKEKPIFRNSDGTVATVLDLPFSCASYMVLH